MAARAPGDPGGSAFTPKDPMLLIYNVFTLLQRILHVAAPSSLEGVWARADLVTQTAPQVLRPVL